MTGVAQAESPAAKPPVSVELSAYQVSTNAKGESVAKPLKQAKPNDIIEYRAIYTNNTAKSVKGLVATLPIPADTQFLAKSTPAQAQASTDGVNFAAMPLKRKTGTQTVNVPLQEYRALRWTIAELPAGKSITVTAQTRVNSTTSAVAQ
ncbi:MAG: hypothetical protein EOO69_00370 [Moraxellaceae bacterium]|nr:MAG: hypothetical protein EOO69_00370 [Moraxellaceae bacterium]